MGSVTEESPGNSEVTRGESPYYKRLDAPKPDSTNPCQIEETVLHKVVLWTPDANCGSHALTGTCYAHTTYTTPFPHPTQILTKILKKHKIISFKCKLAQHSCEIIKIKVQAKEENR